MVGYVPGGGEASNKLNIYSLKDDFMILQTKIKGDICDIISRENKYFLIFIL